jgi:hypothetical protein
MTKGKLILITLLSILFVSNGKSEDGHTAFKAPNFSLELPQGLVIKKVVKVIDYEVYAVSNSKKCLVHLYLGDAPDYTSKNNQIGIYQTHFSVPDTMDMTSTWKDGKLVERNLLINLHPEDRVLWPKYLMIWTDNLSPEEMQLADEVISSVQCRPTKASDFVKQLANPNSK